jgi:hypothetical protein
VADVNTLLAGVTFSPAADFNGNFTIATSVSDGVAPALTGSKSVTGTAVNDAPSGADKTVTTPQNTAYTFTAADFGFSDSNDSPANSLLAVQITSLPAQGTLTDNNIAVNPGQFIPVADITGGLLKFTPVANTTGNGYANFTFQVQDNGGTASGGVDVDPTANSLVIDVTTGGGASGDPHLVTFDGLNYDFQGIGDFVLVRALDSPLDVQVRLESWLPNPATTIIAELATVVDGSRVIFDISKPLPFVNGVAFEIAIGETRAVGEGTLSRSSFEGNSGDVYTLTYANGDQLMVQCIADICINTNVYLIGTDQVVGLLGNNNGLTADDLALRDGTIAANPLALEYLYGAFEDSWQVAADESLFTEPERAPVVLTGNAGDNGLADFLM